MRLQLITRRVSSFFSPSLTRVHFNNLRYLAYPRYFPHVLLCTHNVLFSVYTWDSWLCNLSCVVRSRGHTQRDKFEIIDFSNKTKNIKRLSRFFGQQSRWVCLRCNVRKRGKMMDRPLLKFAVCEWILLVELQSIKNQCPCKMRWISNWYVLVINEPSHHEQIASDHKNIIQTTWKLIDPELFHRY